MRETLEREVARVGELRRSLVAQRLIGAAACAVAAVAIAACGSTSGSGRAASSNPATLLKQTFSASHTVKSGVLQMSLVVTTKGSSELTTPLSLSLDGPFQSSGSGQTPESALTIGFEGLGKSGSIGVTTTSSAAYVKIEGVNYQLPAKQFKSLSAKLGSGSSKDAAPGLSTLGINPESWLSHPQIVGTQTVDGVVTEHLHASVDVPALVASLDKALAKESSTLKSTTGATPHQISPAMAAKISKAIGHPTVDVWTGKNDTTLRRLQIGATVPVSGSLSTELGGLSSATFKLTINYSKLGAPQTITAPTDVHSYAQLEQKLSSIGEGLSSLGSGLGASSGTTAGSTGAAAGASTKAVNKYAKCINGASGNVAKMQRCAKLLNSGG